jgi:ActR/RegA family two-component response regulator
MAERVLLVTPDDAVARATASALGPGDADLYRERTLTDGLAAAGRLAPALVLLDVAAMRGGDDAGAGLHQRLGGRLLLMAEGQKLPAGAMQLLDLIRPDPHRPLTLAQVERAQIELALTHHGGNRTRAARELGISRATLINKIKAYALNR